MPNYDTIFNPLAIPNPLPEGETLEDYKLGKYDIPALMINTRSSGWVALPDGATDLGQEIETVVDSGRSASGALRAKKVCRDLSKINNYKIPFLYAHEWKKILDIFENDFINEVQYFDMQKGMIRRKMYVGNRKATVYAYKQDLSGDVEIWQDCQFNLIDIGPEESEG